jgi:hypothetical protein
MLRASLFLLQRPFIRTKSALILDQTSYFERVSMKASRVDVVVQRSAKAIHLGGVGPAEAAVFECKVAGEVLRDVTL